MHRFFIILVILLLATSCTVFLEENTRVITIARVLDAAGQPIVNAKATAFTYSETVSDALDQPIAQVGNGVTDSNGVLRLTSFYLQRGTTAIVFGTQNSPQTEVSYFVNSTVYNNQLLFDLGDVVLKEPAIVEVKFVNTTMPASNLPFEIVFESNVCNQMITAQGAVDTNASSCYEIQTIMGSLSALNTNRSSTIVTNLNTQVTVVYRIDGNTFTVSIPVTSQNTVYEINY